MLVVQELHRRDGGPAVRQFTEFRQLHIRGQQRVRNPDAPQLIDRRRIPSPRRHLRDTLCPLQWGKILLELLPERTVGVQYNRLILCEILHERGTVVGELRRRPQCHKLRLVVCQRIIVFGVEEEEVHGGMV